ncbi:MAG: hypothetical protein MUE83_03105 [Tabrizicola sp.]|jgi:hypothetical protein|nr:hypothetical protein [Tabrizicola sp.]
MTRIPAVILFLATIAFGLAPLVTPPFTGYDPALFPVEIGRPAIQPAGYAFAIWSVIYLWLIVHAVYGLWKRAEDPVWAPTRLPLTVAIAVGVVWLWIAGQSAVWGTVTIWIMAAGALAAFLRAPTEPDRWLLSGPLAIFAGWLTAAAAVSTGVLIAGYGVLSNAGAALAMLAIVLVIALVVQGRKPRMPVYGLTVVWALVGVIVVNWADTTLVAGAAAAGAVVMLGALGWMARKG